MVFYVYMQAESINPVEYISPLYKTFTRRAAYLGLGVIAAANFGGGLDWSAQPERPTQECWDRVVARAAEPAPEPLPPVPNSLLFAAEEQPNLPEPDNEINTAALKITAQNIRPNLGTGADIGNFENVQEFESLGGLNIVVRRDANLPIDSLLFNEAFERILTAEYDDPHMQAHMWCQYDDLISGRFEGMTRVIRIPAHSQVCYGAIRLKVKQEPGDCNSLGVTFPNPRFFGALQSSRSYVTAAAGALPEMTDQQVARRINRALMHEVAYHGYYALTGESFPHTPEGWDYDEQYVDKYLDPYLDDIIPVGNGHWPEIVPFIDR